MLAVKVVELVAAARLILLVGCGLDVFFLSNILRGCFEFFPYFHTFLKRS